MASASTSDHSVPWRPHTPRSGPSYAKPTTSYDARRIAQVVEQSSPSASPKKPTSHSRSRSGGEPSYAKPTASHRARGLSTPAPRTDESSMPPSPKKIASTKRDFSTAKLSTISSRNRSLWTGPFRFMDLPPELRNRIYSFIVPFQQYLDPRTPLSIRLKSKTCELPRLLQIPNKQFREEVGSYLFTSTYVNMRASWFQYWWQQDLAVRWLMTQIGRLNFRRLLRNKHARTVDIGAHHHVTHLLAYDPRWRWYDDSLLWESEVQRAARVEGEEAVGK